MYVNKKITSARRKLCNQRHLSIFSNRDCWGRNKL